MAPAALIAVNRADLSVWGGISIGARTFNDTSREPDTFKIVNYD